MLNWSIHQNTFSFFAINKEGVLIPISDWRFTLPLEQISILFELAENGFGNQKEDSIEIESPIILNLDVGDKQLLGLPSIYPFEIYIESKGQLNQNDFKFEIGFFDFLPNGNRLSVNRLGPIVKLQNFEYLLSEAQYVTLNTAETRNNKTNFNEREVFKFNLQALALIKRNLKESGIKLDSYLSAQSVIQPEQIKIEPSFKDGVLELQPLIGISNENTFTKWFDRNKEVNDIYSIQNDGEPCRIVLSEKLKEELRKLKLNRKVTDENKISELTTNPEQLFDENIVDISYYSQRVREIGVYKPKFYAFVCPYKSEWIPGFIIEDKISGNTKIRIKTKPELKTFEIAWAKAVASGQQNFIWGEVEVGIDDAARFIKIAKIQLENSKTKVKWPKSEQVLIISENAEVLEYTEHSKDSVEFLHRFIKINNLKNNYTLLTHQIEGIAWLQSLANQFSSGCLLADDMGLGKTLQLLYFLEWHAQFTKIPKPYLIVTPVSILENWENEYYKFFNNPSLPILTLHKSTNLNKGINPDLNKKDATWLQKKQIILTNYETLREYQGSLGLVDFAVVALDEAQKIKTPGTLITNASKALKADFKIAMTGTPVENTLVDLWCIMDFAVPGHLGNARHFAKKYQDPIRDSKTDLQILGQNLREEIGIFLKRRFKSDVAKNLPKKIIHKDGNFKQIMPPVQLSRYNAEIQMASNSNKDGLKLKNHILKTLLALRDISDHPYLLDTQILSFSSAELIASSAKLQVLVEILEKVKQLHEKVIIFADRRETQKFLQKVICDLFMIMPSIVNGDTPTTKGLKNTNVITRQQTIDRFQSEEGFSVIIMSQLAAGVGLNVTKANHVVHYSRHWNPAKEEQATDRAYRIGQLKDVHVYYPMAIFPQNLKNEQGKELKSFDLVLDELLAKKMALASNTLFPTEQAEVRPEDLSSQLLSFVEINSPKKVELFDVDKLQPNLFEAYIAAYFSKNGLTVSLTPYTNDKGADIVVIGSDYSFLIQAKQSSSSVDSKAVQEIVTSKSYYENSFKADFKLMVIANADFNESAIILAEANNVELINRNGLEEMVLKTDLTLMDILEQEKNRLSSI